MAGKTECQEPNSLSGVLLVPDTECTDTRPYSFVVQSTPTPPESYGCGKF